MENNAAVLNETEQVTNTSGVPTDAEQKTPASTDGAQPANDGDDEHPEGSGKEGGYQRVKRQRDEARAREEYWRDRAQNAAPKPAEVAKPAVVEEPEPKEEDFGTTGEYLRAVRAWDKKQIVKEVESRFSKTEQERSAQSEQQKIAETFQQRQVAAREKYADYDDVLSENVRLSPAMAEVMVHSENGPDLAYWLGKNPDKAAEIAKLGPLAAARELGKIEARLAKDESAAEPTTPAAQPHTQAPVPPNPVKKSSAAAADVSPTDPASDKALSDADWYKKREAQKFKR